MGFLDAIGITTLVKKLKTVFATKKEVDEKQDKIVVTTVTIAVADWSSNTATKTVSGVTANNAVLVTYAPASKADYTAADIYCTAQGSGTLTFACASTPSSAITVNILIIGVDVPVFEFSIDNVSYTAENGMTWSQWVGSDYNTDGYYIDTLSAYNYIRDSSQIGIVTDSNSGSVLPNNEITPNANYIIFVSGGGN